MSFRKIVLDLDCSWTYQSHHEHADSHYGIRSHHLVVDLKAVEIFESVPFLPPPPISNEDRKNERGVGDAPRKSKYKESDVANLAHIDCVPLRIPLGELSNIFVILVLNICSICV